MTTAIGQARLHHLLLYSETPEDLVVFYRDVMKMEFTRKDGIHIGHGNRRCIMISEGPNRKLGFGAFTYSEPSELRTLQQRLRGVGVPLHESPCPILNDGFSVVDPDGNRLVFGVDPGNQGGAPDALAARLQHLVVATNDMQPMVDFYTDILGFEVSDRVADDEGDLRACFFHSDEEHHSFAFFKAPTKRLDHHSYECGEWNLIRDWADHMASFDISLKWGPGRHGPGNNLFFMVNDPDGNWVELSAELEHITPERQPGLWPHTEKSLNLWGPGILRS
jgi:catechol 2,3-dioxygenase-like lactoylglutathione lyase family enzyme